MKNMLSSPRAPATSVHNALIKASQTSLISHQPVVHSTPSPRICPVPSHACSHSTHIPSNIPFQPVTCLLAQHIYHIKYPYPSQSHVSSQAACPSHPGRLHTCSRSTPNHSHPIACLLAQHIYASHSCTPALAVDPYQDERGPHHPQKRSPLLLGRLLAPWPHAKLLWRAL